MNDQRIEKLLLVDDQDLDLRLLKNGFAEADPRLTLETCTNSAEVIDKALATKADLILLDINMPGLNGLEVLQELRNTISGTFPVVIMLTTSENPADLRTAYRHGASAYVVKPSSVEGYAELAASIVTFWTRMALRPAA